MKLYTISASASSLTLTKGTTTTSTLTLISINGFTGTVSLAPSISPSKNNSPDISMNPASVSLSSGGTGISTLAVSAPNNSRGGTYTITVSAVSGLITHQLIITVNITT